MGVNKTQLLGRLKDDPVIRKNDNGQMASFTLATNEIYYDSDGQKKEITGWHKVVAFNNKAIQCNKFLKKGSRVFIEGRNNTRSYTKEGKTLYITEVQVKDVQFLN